MSRASRYMRRGAQDQVGRKSLNGYSISFARAIEAIGSRYFKLLGTSFPFIHLKRSWARRPRSSWRRLTEPGPLRFEESGAYSLSPRSRLTLSGTSRGGPVYQRPATPLTTIFSKTPWGRSECRSNFKGRKVESRWRRARAINGCRQGCSWSRRKKPEEALTYRRKRILDPIASVSLTFWPYRWSRRRKHGTPLCSLLQNGFCPGRIARLSSRNSSRFQLCRMKTGPTTFKHVSSGSVQA